MSDKTKVKIKKITVRHPTLRELKEKNIPLEESLNTEHQIVDVEFEGDKMSDERKGLIKRLDAYFIEHLIMASQEVRDLFREVRVAIQQKPEIDDMEKYVEEKAKELCIHLAKHGYSLMSMERFITQIISDARGGKVDEAFIKKWADEISQQNYLTDELNNCITKMLTDAGVKIK